MRPSVIRGALIGVIAVLIAASPLVASIGRVSGVASATSVTEGFLVVLAGAIFLTCMAKYYLLDDDLSLFVGLSFFAAGILDMIHPLTGSAIRSFLPRGSQYLESLSVLSRILGGLLLFLASQRGLRVTRDPFANASAFFIAVAVALATFVLAIFFAPIPPLITAAGQTALGRVLQVIALVFVLGALIGFYSRYKETGEALYAWIALALAFGLASNFYFALHTSENDALYAAAHILKSVMYFGVLFGVLVEQIQLLTREQRLMLRAEFLERERMIAETLQESLIPAETPPIPGLDVGVYYASATQQARVGGDLYDFITLPQRRVGLVVADVSGKGVEAAAYMAMVKYSLRGFAYETETPSSVMNRLNDSVYRQTQPDIFITLFYGVYDPRTAVFAYANAGHPPPILYRRNVGKPRLLMPTGAAIGVLKEERYRMRRIGLAPGDALIFYTDGLTEARKDSEFFGEQRLLELCRGERNFSGQQWVEMLFAECMRFCEGTLDDDLIIVAIKPRERRGLRIFMGPR